MIKCPECEHEFNPDGPPPLPAEYSYELIRFDYPLRVSRGQSVDIKIVHTFNIATVYARLMSGEDCIGLTYIPYNSYGYCFYINDSVTKLQIVVRAKGIDPKIILEVTDFCHTTLFSN